MQLSPETGMSLYNLLGNLQWPAYVAVLLWATAKYRFSAKNKIVLWVAFVVARFWSADLVPVLSRITGGIIPGINLGVAFGLFVMIVAAIAYFFQVPVTFSLDVTIPAFILGRGLAITGCIFAGCCYGFPVSWGIYSSAVGVTTFPTVILDVMASCSIVLYLILLSRKQNYCGNGIVTAKGMILFGLLRVLIDVLRDNQKLLLLFTFEGFCGIAYAIAGYLILNSISKRGEANVI